jgi:hypothetical protein
MKRTLVSAMLLAAGVVLAAGTASAGASGTAARHIRGVVAPQGGDAPEGTNAIAKYFSDVAADSGKSSSVQITSMFPARGRAGQGR